MAEVPVADRGVEPQSTLNAAITRLSPYFGAQIDGVDLGDDFSDAQTAELWGLLVEHKVLMFRDQKLSAKSHAAFGRRFGRLEQHPSLAFHPDDPEITVIAVNEERRSKEDIFHTDTSFRELPSLSSILRCVRCPAVGGDTVFADMAQAYQGLPETVKDEIEELRAVHDALYAFGFHYEDDPEKYRQMRRELPPVEHPVVVTHPESNERILYVNQAFTTHLTNHRALFGSSRGLKMRGIKLLTYLLEQPEIPDYQVRIDWRPDTVVMWDNRSVQHYAVADYWPEPREMWRALITGTQRPTR